MSTEKHDFTESGATSASGDDPTVADADRAETPRMARRFMPVLAAGLLSALWVGGLLFYFASTGELAALAQTATGLLGFAAGLATPVAVFWLVALAFQRTDPMLEKRVAMAQTLHKAMAPVEAAEQRLGLLNKSLRKELQNIEAVADLASDRIDNLEKRFQEQISNLFSATADTEARTTSIRDLLERERTAVDQLTEQLEGRFSSLEDMVRTMGERLERAGDFASETAASAKERVDTSLLAINEAATDMESRLDRAGTDMTEKATKMQDVAVEVELRLHSITESVMNGMDRFRHDVEGLEGRSAELSEHMKTQANVLKELAELAAAESAKIEQSLRTHVGEVRTAATEALERTSDVSNMFSERAQAMSEKVIQTVDQAKALLEEAGRSLEDHCAEALTTSERVNSQTLETTEATGKAVIEHAQEVDRVLSAGLERARAALDDTMTAITGHSNAAVAEAESAAERTLQHIRQLRAGVEEQIEHLAEVGRKSADELANSADLIGDRTADLSGKAEEAKQDLEAVRHQMETQGDHLADVLNDTRMKLARLEEDLTSQRDALTNASQEAADKVIEAAERFASHSTALSDSADASFDKLDGRTAEIVSMIEKLSSSGESSSAQLSTATADLAKQSSELQKELASSSSALGSAAEAFAGERTRILEETETIVGRINKSTDKMGSELERFTDGSMEAANRLEAATQTLMDQTQRAQAEMHRSITDTQEELSSTVEGISNSASERITYLREELQATLARVLSDYQETADQAEKESALLAMRLGNEAEKIAQQAETFITKSAEIEKRIAASTRNDFARTSALLMESLQSTSIDINKALSHDLPDDVWESYLSGDKSVFMRRTLKMADRKTRKMIADKYKADGEFREAASRYCRDFEGMMERAMMGDRGSAMAVTLISSDMGKLYVLIGQSLKKFS